jgi:hypothetical protein
MPGSWPCLTLGWWLRSQERTGRPWWVVGGGPVGGGGGGHATAVPPPALPLLTVCLAIAAVWSNPLLCSHQWFDVTLVSSKS